MGPLARRRAAWLAPLPVLVTVLAVRAAAAPAAPPRPLVLFVHVAHAADPVDGGILARDAAKALEKAGCRVVDDLKRADGLLRLSVDAREVKGATQVSIGKAKWVKRSFELWAAVLSRDGAVVAETVQRYTTTDEWVPAAELARVVKRLRAQPAFLRFREEAARRADEGEAEREQIARAAAAADDGAWEGAGGAACGEPQSPTACDGVRAYLAERPDGRHAARARELLELAGPGLRAAQDRADWEAASPDWCRAPTTPSDCVRVRLYLSRHPDGLHAAEARALLDAAERGAAP